VGAVVNQRLQVAVYESGNWTVLPGLDAENLFNELSVQGSTVPARHIRLLKINDWGQTVVVNDNLFPDTIGEIF
jgi:hypothetical protein